MSQEEQISQNFKGIIDTTLREGLQFSKANFTMEEMKRRFDYLSRIGVEYIEVANPLKNEIRYMINGLCQSRPGNSPKILAHIRNCERDLERAIECNIDGVNILCSVDPERISAMNMTEQKYKDLLKKNIDSAQSHHLEIRVGVEDSFNQPFAQCREIYELADESRVNRIGMADTLGNSMNWKIYNVIKDFRSRFKADIEVHLHNDLGHSVSNALAAFAAGANWINTSLLGIGERTGITPLSSLLINLYRLDPELISHYNLSLLTVAENYVSKICNIEVPMNLVTNRVNGFAHKAGIHLDALIKFGPEKYESFSPRLIGNNRNLVINRNISGKTSYNDVKRFNKRYDS